MMRFLPTVIRVCAHLVTMASSVKMTIDCASLPLAETTVSNLFIPSDLIRLSRSPTGTCVNTTRGTFACICDEGWTGAHCEASVNYCENVTCKNNGVCRPTFRDYQCDCVSASYSGRHCETTASSLASRQKVTRSFGYVAILFLAGVFLFIGMLDVLKYIFRIDPARDDRARQVTRDKATKPRAAIRFIYVN